LITCPILLFERVGVIIVNRIFYRVKTKKCRLSKGKSGRIFHFFIKNTVFKLLYIIIIHFNKIKHAIVRKFTGVIIFPREDFIITKRLF